MNKKAAFFAVLVLVFALPAVSGNAQEFEPVYPPAAIINAAYRGDEKAVMEILKAGCDKDIRDSVGATALHVAVYNTNTQVLKLLLDYGFDPNATITKNGCTPLHNAVTANNPAAVRILLQYGADPDIKDFNGSTPLDRARKEEKTVLVRLLYH